MYIGPWQEYKLSKQRDRRAPAPREIIQPSNDVLKRQLEQALQSTLDPQAALTAIKAVGTLFEANASKSNVQQRLALPLHSKEKYQHVFPDESLGSFAGDDSLTRQVREHDLTQRRQLNPGVTLSARDKYLQPSPISVRSTQSEPTQSLPSLIQVSPAAKRSSGRMQALPMTEQFASLNSTNLSIHQANYQPQLSARSGKPPMARPAPIKALQQSPLSSIQDNKYDTAAVVNFLRMERNQRARLEISRLTGWTAISSSSDPVCSVALPPKKSKLEVHKEKQLEQVQQMRALYLNGAAGVSPRDNGAKSTLLPPLGGHTNSHTTSHSVVIPSGGGFSQGITDSLPGSAESSAIGLPPRSLPQKSQNAVPRRSSHTEHLTEDDFMLVSKYFEDGDDDDSYSSSKRNIQQQQQQDYQSIPLQHASLQKNNSMDLPVVTSTGSVKLQRHRTGSDEVSEGPILTQQQSTQQLTRQPSQASSVGKRPHRESSGSKGDSDVDEEDQIARSPPKRSLGIAQQHDIPRTPLLGTGSFTEDMQAGHLEKLLNWTQGLEDDFDLS